MAKDENNQNDLIPLAPLDEEEERKRREAQLRDLRANGDILAAMTRQPSIPLEHRENLTTADLEHFVINYCLDAFEGKRERTRQYEMQLRRFGTLGRETVEEFLAGKQEPAVKHIPTRQLERILRSLKDDLREG